MSSVKPIVATLDEKNIQVAPVGDTIIGDYMPLDGSADNSLVLTIAKKMKVDLTSYASKQDLADALQGILDEANRILNEIKALQGTATYLQGHDFGSFVGLTDQEIQDLFNNYAFSIMPGWQTSGIPNSVFVLHTGTGEEWVYNSSLDLWFSYGQATVAVATNTSLGIIKGSTAPGSAPVHGDGSLDLSAYATQSDLASAVAGVSAGLPNLPLVVAQGGTSRVTMPTVKVALGSETATDVIPFAGDSTPGVSGVLPINHGGTGADNVADALANLGVPTIELPVVDNPGSGVLPPAGNQGLESILNVFRANIKFILAKFPIGTADLNMTEIMTYLQLNLTNLDSSNLNMTEILNYLDQHFTPPGGTVNVQDQGGDESLLVDGQDYTINEAIQIIRNNLSALIQFKYVMEQWQQSVDQTISDLNVTINDLHNQIATASNSNVFCTQAEYDALTPAEQNSGQTFFIYETV